MIDIDTGKKHFEELLPIWEKDLQEIESEQDTRLRIIDRIFVEVLGWDRSEMSTDKHVSLGYVDYLLISENRNRLVIEAKKTTKLLIDTRDPKRSSYKVGGAPH